MKNKKAAIGATMTWVVATIIILVVIVVFVYAAGAFALLKGFLGDEVGEVTGLSSSVDSEQMLLALLETEVDGKNVEQLVIEDEEEILKNSLRPILQKIPACLSHDKKEPSSWIFTYNEADKSDFWAKRIGKTSLFDATDAPTAQEPSLSIIYLSNNKIVKFYEVCP